MYSRGCCYRKMIDRSTRRTLRSRHRELRVYHPEFVSQYYGLGIHPPEFPSQNPCLFEVQKGSVNRASTACSLVQETLAAKEDEVNYCRDGYHCDCTIAFLRRAIREEEYCGEGIRAPVRIFPASRCMVRLFTIYYRGCSRQTKTCIPQRLPSWPPSLRLDPPLHPSCERIPVW